LGADAVLLTASVLNAGEVRTFMEICSSMHMAAPIEVRSETELSAAVDCGARIVVLPAFAEAELSLDPAKALLPKVPRTLTVLVRGPFAAREDFEPLRGLSDGIWTAGPLMKANNLATFLRDFVEAAENG